MTWTAVGGGAVGDGFGSTLRAVARSSGVALAALLIAACGGDDTGSGGAGSGGSDGSGGSPSGSTPTCAEFCEAATKACGAEPPSCEATCAGLSAAIKTCVVEAESCEAMDACGSASNTSSTSSTSSTSTATSSSSSYVNPCDPCTPDQFCVIGSSVESEIGCIDPPDSCNGDTTMFCSCLVGPTGPCSQGADGCSEGASNTVTCR